MNIQAGKRHPPCKWLKLKGLGSGRGGSSVNSLVYNVYDFLSGKSAVGWGVVGGGLARIEG